MAFSFGNVGLIGIPLILPVFGQRAMVVVAMFSIVDLVILWTYGLSLTYPVENKPKISFRTLKNMLNPPLIAIILSVVVIMLGIRIPEIANRAFMTISNSGLPLPFIYIGGLLASQGIKRFAKFYELYLGILAKMIIFPICVFIVLRAIGIEPDVIGTIVILFGLPAVGVLPMLADTHGSDVEYATAAIIIPTLAALFTITLVSYVTSVI
jgi:predicted permease